MSTRNSALHAQLVDDLDATQGNAALCVLSLDNLGRIAGEFGIGASEQATLEFDNRVSSIMRRTDRKLKLAPDRICVVFDELRDPNHTLLVALKIQRMFDEPVHFQDAVIKLTPRAGFVYCGSTVERADNDVDNLYQHAETARELAVEQDTCFQIADNHSVRQARDDWSLDDAIEDALLHHHIELLFQPQVDLQDGRIVGFESLLRWRREGRLLTPDAFVPMLSAPRARQLADYNLRAAMRASTELDTQLSLSINLDATVLRDTGFFDTLDRETTIWRIEPPRLSFEVAEAALTADYERTATILSQLRETGHGVAIDHFGASYSSLGDFPTLPAATIKIDRSFVTAMLQDEAKEHITRTIIDLAHRFDKVVVAEGIEDAATAARLLEQGCDVGQGGHFGRPLNLQGTKALLAGIARS